jgi:quercetin dioxygenase-like cupin family protein
MASLNRRSALFLGAAFTPVLSFARSAAAASMYGPEAGKEIMPGIRQVELGKWPIGISSYKTATVTDYVFAPGSGFPDEAMKNDMICQIMEGEVWVKQGDKTYTAKAGHVFTCAKGTNEEDKNLSNAPAVMRVIDLLPA